MRIVQPAPASLDLADRDRRRERSLFSRWGSPQFDELPICEVPQIDVGLVHVVILHDEQG